MQARLLGSLRRGNKICGATDIALTERGHEQAIVLGKQLAAEKLTIDEILYSPLVRASETARHISEETGILPPNVCEGGVSEAHRHHAFQWLQCKHHR